MAEGEIIYSDKHDAAYLSDHEAVVIFAKGSTTGPVLDKISKPASAIQQTEGSDEIAFWGDDNLFPYTVLEECSKNTIVGSTLDIKARALYSGGLLYGKLEYKENGEEIFMPDMKNKEINDWLKRTNIKRYLMEAASDFYWFYNVFPELILSNDRSKITGIFVQEATFCRWGLQDKSGIVKKMYLNANWNNGGTTADAKKINVIDPYYDPVTALKERTDGFNYIYPISFPTPGKTYYQLAHWNSLRTSGWLDVANLIPEFKKSLMKNQITVKYHIKVADWWWSWKFPQWSALSKEEKIKLQETELQIFNDFLTGSKNAGKSIMTSFKSDPISGKEYAGWEILAVDDKIKDGIYVEDSQEASSHLLYALSVDPSIVGNGPGKAMGAGSGSDKRVAFNMYISMIRAHQDILLEPLDFIRDFNGWDENIVWRFRNSLVTTLDKGKETQQQSS